MHHENYAFAIEEYLKRNPGPQPVEQLAKGLASLGWPRSSANDLENVLLQDYRFHFAEGGWCVDQAFQNRERLDAALLKEVNNSPTPINLSRLIEIFDGGASNLSTKSFLAARAEYIRSSPALQEIATDQFGPAARQVLPRFAPQRRSRPAVTGPWHRIQNGTFQNLDHWDDIATSIANTLKAPAFEMLSLAVNDTRDSHTIRISPLSMRKLPGLIAWTTPVNHLAAIDLSLDGWWLWEADDPGTLISPTRLIYPEYCEPDLWYRGAVFSTDLRLTADFVTNRLESLSDGRIDICQPGVQLLPQEVFRARRQAIAHVHSTLKTPRPVLGFCWSCERPLTTPQSAKRNLGPDCYAKLRRLFDSDADFFEALDAKDDQINYWLRPVVHTNLLHHLLETDGQ